MEIKEAIEMYNVNLLNKNLSDNTISDYLNELIRFKEFLLDKRKEHLDEIKIFDIEQYFALMIKNKNSPNTRNKKRSTLNGFFNYLQRRNLIEENPIDAINSVKVRDVDVKVSQPLSEEELAKIKEKILIYSRQPEKNLAIFDLMGTCGLRVDELTNVKWSDLDEEKGSLLVRGKGGKIRYVPVFEDILENLKSLRKKQPDNCKYIINYKSGSSKVSTRSIFHTVRHYANLAGITRDIGCHTLRSSAATNFLTSGVNVKYIQMLLGHSDISTTSRYLRPMDEEMAKALEDAYLKDGR